MSEFPAFLSVEITVVVGVNELPGLAFVDTGYEGDVIRPTADVEGIDRLPEDDTIALGDSTDPANIRRVDAWDGHLVIADRELLVRIKAFGTTWLIGSNVLSSLGARIDYGNETVEFAEERNT
jgi:hypothetical protein